MEKNKVKDFIDEKYNYQGFDGLILTNRTPEEIDKELEILKKESDKLTDWPKM